GLAPHDHRHQSLAMAGSHDDQVAAALVGGIHDRVVRMLALRHQSVARHARRVRSPLNECQKTRRLRACLLVHVLVDPRGLHIPGSDEHPVIRHDVYPGDSRAAQFRELDSALDGSFRVLGSVGRHEDVFEHDSSWGNATSYSGTIPIHHMDLSPTSISYLRTKVSLPSSPMRKTDRRAG